MYSFNNSALFSACLNRVEIVEKTKYKALAATSNFLLVTICLNRLISLSASVSHPIMVATSLVFQLCKVLLGIIDLNSSGKELNLYRRIKLVWYELYFGKIEL